MAAEPPPGEDLLATDFVTVSRSSFMDHVGPILQAKSDPEGVARLAVKVEKIHANMLGLMHGGMLATLIDSAMARALVATLKRRSVTLKMSAEYLDVVRQGDVAVATGRLVSHDRDFGFTTCEVRVGEALKARATGVFRLLKPY